MRISQSHSIDSVAHRLYTLVGFGRAKNRLHLAGFVRLMGEESPNTRGRDAV